MRRSAASTRSQIVTAADRLVYTRGFAHMSFADIAEEVGLSRGNFYYHFRSKDEILDAVLEARVAATRDMLAGWERDEPTAQGRIRRFAQIVISNESDIASFGCPVGTLTTELAKLDHPAREQAVTLFSCFREWLAEQFVALGRDEDADDLAMHVLAFSQGVAVLSNAFHDTEFVRREVDLLDSWVAAAAQAASTPA